MNTTLTFTKPYILVTRVGENNTNNPYLNPVQRYYEFEHMNILFRYAARYLKREETPLTALHITTNEHDEESSNYFHDFPTALDEYKRGVRSHD